MAKPQVWKFEIPYGRNITVPMPEENIPLKVEFQDEKLTLWALVDPEAPKKPHDFTVVATGDEIGWDIRFAESCPHRDYLGTIQYKAMVYHVFKGQW